MDSVVLKRAYINVKGRNVKKWKRCFVKATDGVLCYYNEQESPNDMIENLALLEGFKVERTDKKETKEEFALKIHQPANKSFVPLFLAAESESEIEEWRKDIQKCLDVGTPVIFGVDLSVVVRKNKQAIPILIEKCIQFLKGSINVPGIFRVSGAMSEVMAFKAAYDRGEDPDLNTCKDPHVISNVLKMYLRELPNPLLTAESYQKFIDANSLPGDSATQTIKGLVNSLPIAHRTTLHHLMQFLTTVAAQSGENKMTSANLAIVFGPTILRPGKDEKMEDAGNMEIANRVTERLIHNYDQIFEQNLPPIRKAKGHQHSLSGNVPIASLPEGWVEHISPEGKPYYYNATTQTTTWDRPAPVIIEPRALSKGVQNESPRSAPGSPATSRSKSLLFPTELTSQLSKMHQQQLGDSGDAPRKRPPSGSGTAPLRNESPPAVGGTPIAPDADELKSKLKARAQPKPPGAASPVPVHHSTSSPALLPLPPSSLSPPSTHSNLASSGNIPPPHSPTPPPHLAPPPPLAGSTSPAPPPHFAAPPPMTIPPPLNVPPPLTTPSSLVSPPPAHEDKPLPSKPAPPLAKSDGPVNPVVAKSSAGKQRPAAPPRASPPVSQNNSPHNSTTQLMPPPEIPAHTLHSSLTLSPPPPITDDDKGNRVQTLEARIAVLEQQQQETNTLLRTILGILESNNLSAQS